MRKFRLFLLALLLTTVGFSANGATTADFTAKESIKRVFYENFDSLDELNANGWELIKVTNPSDTWAIGNLSVSGLPSFSTINSTSTASLFMMYSHGYKDDVLRSPKIEINPNSSFSFYTAFHGVWIMSANLTIEIEKVSTGTKEKVFDAFQWSQIPGNGFDTHKWLYFDIDLAEYAGEEVYFHFAYTGTYGEDVLIDDFAIFEKGGDSVVIPAGETVNFESLATGEIKSYAWTFQGGTPATSTEENPSIVYNVPGKYNVALAVTNMDDETFFSTKTEFVEVQGFAPQADIEVPTDKGYLSPYSALFIPQNTELTFIDKTKNMPTEWLWSFEGATPASSTEQNPTVKYEEEGLFGLSLTAKNNIGEHSVEMQNMIKVGGTAEVWNIEVSENENLGAIELGWYGYYGGGNGLGMLSFAESFKAPIVPITISEVAVYFDRVDHVTDTTIVVKIHQASAEGMPGEVVATSSLNIDQLQDPNAAGSWIQTFFQFDNPVEISEDFFVSVEGMPFDYGDEVAIGAIRRTTPSNHTTSYHYLELEDDYYQPTGEFAWFKSDEPVSLAISPVVTYANDTETSVDKNSISKEVLCVNPIQNNTLQLFHSGDITALEMHDLTGRKIISLSSNKISPTISLYGVNPGVYLLRAHTSAGMKVQTVIVK